MNAERSRVTSYSNSVKAVRTKNHSRPAAATLAPKAAGRSGDVASTLGWVRFAPVFIALAVVAVYATAPGLNFIGFDDREILKQHYFIIGDLSKIKLAFTTDAFLGTNGAFIVRCKRSVSCWTLW